MPRQDPISRAKPKPEGEEEATSVLNLGEFQNVDALSLSEASIIINAVLAKRAKEGRKMNQNKYGWHLLSASERLPGERKID
jgi:DNA-directed RNA polymerase II subunit RPB4